MKNLLLFILTILTPTIGLSQDINERQSNDSFKKQLEIIATHQINQLHEGFLLIRLKHRKKSIAALRKSEKTKAADKIDERQKRLDKAIVIAFRKHFDFCPVYFFFSDHSQNVMEHQLAKVEFLNKNLFPDTNIAIGKNEFLMVITM